MKTNNEDKESKPEPRLTLNLDRLEENLLKVARDLHKISEFNKLHDEIVQRDGKLF